MLRYAAPRPIPNVPAWLEGVIDYGGRVVPVIDLRARFELGAAPRRESARILVVVAGDDWIGAIVDGVDEVLSVPSEPPRAAAGALPGAGEDRTCARWCARRAEEGPVIVVLDVAQLLTARERIVLEQAVSGARPNG